MTFTPNLNFNSTRLARDVSDAMSAFLDWAVIAQSEAEYKERGSGSGDVAYNRIGAGYIGTPCDRELAFRYHRFPKEVREGGYPKGPLGRHAQAGHWTEARTADWLRYAGFQIKTFVSDEHGEPVMEMGKPKQLGFKAAKCLETGKFRLAGEFDGVITALPDALPDGIDRDLAATLLDVPMPCIWESKKGTDKKWKKFKKEGVKKADPKYYGQLQTNMAYSGIEATLFSMLNLDTMEYYWEHVKPDLEVAQKLTDRAVRVMQSADPFEFAPLSANPATYHECKFCDFQGACAKGREADVVQAVGWGKPWVK